MRRQGMTTTRVSFALILAGLCVCALSIRSLGSGQALTGWAVPIGTQTKLGAIFWGIDDDFGPPYVTAQEGYYFIRLKLQVQNTSPKSMHRFSLICNCVTRRNTSILPLMLILREKLNHRSCSSCMGQVFGFPAFLSNWCYTKAVIIP